MKTESTFNNISHPEIHRINCDAYGIKIDIDVCASERIYITLAELREALKRCELHHDVVVIS